MAVTTSILHLKGTRREHKILATGAFSADCCTSDNPTFSAPNVALAWALPWYGCVRAKQALGLGAAFV